MSIICSKLQTFPIYYKTLHDLWGWYGSNRSCKRHGFNPWFGKTPGVGNGNPLQYSCMENSMDREAWQAAHCMGWQRVETD